MYCKGSDLVDASLISALQSQIKGEVSVDQQTLDEFSHDASLFEIEPSAVVFPKSTEDVQAIVSFVSKHKKEHSELSLTARSAGTDMAGGSINDSIIIAFGKYFNRAPVIHDSIATTEPGVFYRDFEKETLKNNLLFLPTPHQEKSALWVELSTIMRVERSR